MDKRDLDMSPMRYSPLSFSLRDLPSQKDIGAHKIEMDRSLSAV
jgi:hypothetical protein